MADEILRGRTQDSKPERVWKIRKEWPAWLMRAYWIRHRLEYPGTPPSEAP